MNSIYPFLSYCKKYKYFIFISILLEITFAIISLATPEVLRLATNAIENKSVTELRTCTILAIVSTIIYIALTSTIKVLEMNTSNKCEQCMQGVVLDKLFLLRKLRIKQYSSGDVITLITQNTPIAISNSLSFLFNISQGIAVILIGVVYMGILNVKLMIAMVLFNVIVRLFSVYFQTKIKMSSKIVAKTTKRNNNFLIDLLHNIIIIRIFDRLDYFKDKLFEKESESMMANWKNFNWYNGFSEIIWFTQKAAQICIAFGFGGYLVFKGETSFSIILTFTISIDLFTKGLNSIMSALADRSNALPNIEAVINFLNDPDVENQFTSSNVSAEDFYIKLENVCFRFGEKEVLNNISFTIHANEKVLIEGPNGEGKSTLLNLILGLYKPDSGKIYYGNCDISKMSIDDICRNYSYISQNSYITVGNIYNNIALSENCNEQELDDILEKLNLSRVKQNDPQSYSQGEIQRLNIARALFKCANVKLVLGDEIFSNVDASNKKNIAAMLSLQFKYKTVIMVSHDDMYFKFDKKLVVTNKNVKEVIL